MRDILKLAAVQSSGHSYLNQERSLSARANFKENRTAAFARSADVQTLRVLGSEVPARIVYWDPWTLIVVGPPHDSLAETEGGADAIAPLTRWDVPSFRNRILKINNREDSCLLGYDVKQRAIVSSSGTTCFRRPKGFGFSGLAFSWPSSGTIPELWH